jgi:hypothetical protein
MKNASYFWFIFSVTASLYAQQATITPAPVLPPGPLLKPAPDYTKWTVSSKGKSTKGPKSSKEKTNIIKGEKTGSILHVRSASGNGGVQETWSNGKVQVITNLKWEKPLISNGVPEEFPVPQWISEHNFTAIKNESGKQCLIFHDKVFPGGGEMTSDMMDHDVDPESLKVEATAIIDADTRLPVRVTLGDETITYKFERLRPDEALHLPPEIEAVIMASNQKVEADRRAPVRP